MFTEHAVHMLVLVAIAVHACVSRYVCGSFMNGCYSYSTLILSECTNNVWDSLKICVSRVCVVVHMYSIAYTYVQCIQ